MGEYLGMRFNSFKIKSLIFIAVLFTIALPSFAIENIISSVVISKAKDSTSAYELSIDSTQQVQYKSYIDSDGNIYFDLKNSTLAPNMGTIYDDVSEIDNVVVKQMPKNKVRIYVNGKDAKKTELIFVNALFETSKETKNIVINRPISEYKSTSYYDDLEYSDITKEWDDNSFDFENLSSIVLSEIKEGPIGKVLIILSLFVILSILVKSLANKVAQDKEPLITPNKVQIGSLGASVDLSKQKMINNTKRSEALKQAQNELAKAHEKYQQYIQNKYQGLQKPKSIDVDLVKKSFALNQYQKSTQNPYENQEVIRINKGFSTDTQLLKGNFQIPPRAKINTNTQFTSPYIKRKNNFVNENLTNEQPKKNMKFLESVTKIYENSGRGDLADELKNSISKAKQNI